MIHYTCDCCKRPLSKDNDIRYVVKMEVYASLDPVEGEQDSDRDHLQELQEILDRLDDASNDQIGDDVYKVMRFDLCRECRAKVVRNPLGQSTVSQFDFSEN